MRRLFPPLKGLADYDRFLRYLTQRSNEYLLSLVEEVADGIESSRGPVHSPDQVQGAGQWFISLLLDKRNAFVLKNQQTMLASIGIAA